MSAINIQLNICKCHPRWSHTSVDNICAECGVKIFKSDLTVTRHNLSKNEQTFDIHGKVFKSYDEFYHYQITTLLFQKLEIEFYASPVVHPHLRYGQLMCNKLKLPKNIEDEIYYDTNPAIARNMIWNYLNELGE